MCLSGLAGHLKPSASHAGCKHHLSEKNPGARIVDIACGEANLWLLNRMNIKMHQQILKVFKS